MNVIAWLVVGGLTGWVASFLLRSSESTLANIIVGIAGAFAGGSLIGPLLGGGTINSGSFTVASLVASLLGAVILLVVVKLVRR